MSKIICIDPGHCDKFAGASNGSRREENDNLRMALAVEKYLVSFGHRVYLTRRTGANLDSRNADLDLDARPLCANKVKADYFISIHRNSYADAKASGIEGWIYSKADANVTKIAQSVLSECIKVAPVANRGIKKGYTGHPEWDYAVNRISTMPSMLLELLFIKNNSDNAIYDANFEAYAKAIAVGICKGLGVNYTPAIPAKPTVAPVNKPVAVPLKPTTTAAKPAEQKYKVLPGDSFCGISQKMYGTETYADAIAKANGFKDKYAIFHPGIILKIPTNPVKTPVISTPVAKERTYTVLPGDSFNGISKKMYGTEARANDIAVANGFKDKHAVFHPGKVLKIPK